MIAPSPAPKRRIVEPAAPSPDPVFDTTPVHHEVQRASLERYGDWMMRMLQEDFGASPATIVRWTRQWQLDNSFCFVGTENAVGLAVLVQEPLRPSPVVLEAFMYVRSGEFKAEGITIYKHFANWAKLSHASKFRFNDCPGAPMTEIKAVLPGVRYEKMWTVDL